MRIGDGKPYIHYLLPIIEQAPKPASQQDTNTMTGITYENPGGNMTDS